MADLSQMADLSTAGGPSNDVRADGAGRTVKAMATPVETLDRNTVFHTLSNQRRRHALHYLKRHGDETPVTVREMSRTLAAWENGIESEQVTSAERKRVYNALYQNHLPQMARIGVIEYDQDRGQLSLTDAIEAFDIYLEVVPQRELNWGEFYLGVSAIAVTLVVLQALAFPPFGPLSGTWLAGAIALVFAFASTVQVIRKRTTRIGDTALPPDVAARTRAKASDEERVA